MSGTWEAKRRMYLVVSVGAGLLLLGLMGCDLLPWGGEPLSAPDEVSATQDAFTDRVRVTWAPVPEAGGYEVWRASRSAGEYQFIGRTGHLSYDDFGVTPGVTYWYKVRACNRVSCSEFSPPAAGRAAQVISSPPPVPSGVEASQGTFPGSIRITWPQIPGALHYGLYRDELATGPYTLIATVEGTEYEDRDITPGKTYWYRLQACNELGCSELSQPVSGYAGFAGLHPPQGLTATDGEHPDKVVITWEAVDEATSYLLYRAPAEEGTYQLLVETGDTSYEDFAVVPGTEYWYRVRACNEQGCSSLSEPDSGSAAGDGGPPPPPQ